MIDDKGQLLLIKHTKLGQEPYWTTPGGGVENGDATIEVAFDRELREELGAEAVGASQVFLSSSPSDDGAAVQHFVARLIRLDGSAGSDPEFSNPSRGEYELDRIDPRADEMSSIDLWPTALKEFILANREVLMAEGRQSTFVGRVRGADTVSASCREVVGSGG